MSLTRSPPSDVFASVFSAKPVPPCEEGTKAWSNGPVQRSLLSLLMILTLNTFSPGRTPGHLMPDFHQRPPPPSLTSQPVLSVPDP